MKRTVTTVLLFALCSLWVNTLYAQIGSWRAYMSYYEPQQIVKAGSNTLFVRASNSLYSYNLNDHSITTYDKVSALSDTYITLIAWNQQVKRLIIVYQNCNIDLIDLEGNVTNISSYYSKSMTEDKNINTIYMNGKYAYLGTGFGVVKVNMEKAEISESYNLGRNIQAITIDDGKIYVQNNYTSVFVASLNSNLIDKNNWQYTTTYPSMQQDNTDWETYLPTVSTLQPGGPKYNNFGFLMYKNNMLYTCSGTGGGTVTIPATVQIKNGDDWEFLQDDMTDVPGTEGEKWAFVDMYSLDIDPFDSKHIFAGGRTGLYEYYDGKLVKYYNKDNSILESATTSNRFVLTDGVKYDSEGNLWMLQSQVKSNSLVELTKDGEWVKHDQSLLMNNGLSLNNLKSIMIDSQGLFWFVNDHWSKSSFYCYDPKTDQIVNYMVQLVNQDGASIDEVYNPAAIVEDLNNDLWLCTNKGLFMIERSQVSSPLEYVNQIKVPRNDGTNYADYLLNGVDVTCMVIDGANRKWIGTNGVGVYLISADNMEQVANFTTSNSPILSDNIRSVAINNETGEVFIGTDKGLCSYMSDATSPTTEMTKDNVYAYPNPVVKGYDGLISVVGLTYDADVKILTVNGRLVAEGRSNGGTFTWNGRDSQGRRVASGIYMVSTATSDGQKGVVCKIAIVN